MPVWVVRAGAHGEQEQFALGNNAAVVGWDEVIDLRSLTNRDQLLPLLTKTYASEAENTLKNWKPSFGHSVTGLESTTSLSCLGNAVRQSPSAA